MSAVGRFIWSEGKKDFALYLIEEIRYIHQVSQEYPLLGDILRCYGDPEYFTLEEAPMGIEARGIGVRLELWYPDRGLKFQGETWGSNEIRRYNAESPIIGLIMVRPPDTIEEMIRNGQEGADEYVKERMALLQEWPDEFTELVLEK